jgi:hypothetical protein
VLEANVIRRVLPIFLILALAPATAGAAVSRKKAIAGPVEFNGASQFATYAKLGAGIYIATLDYKTIAVQPPEDPADPTDPGYEWPSDLDEASTDAARYHIQIALTLKGGDQDFATAAAKRFPKARLWIVTQSPKTSAKTYVKTLNSTYTALKKRSKGNLVVAQPRSPQTVKGAKLDLFGYTPAAKKALKTDTLGELESKVSKAAGKTVKLFVSGWTLNTAGQAGAKQLTAGFKAAKADKDVYTLGYDGLVDSDVIGSDGRTPSTGLINSDGTQRPAFSAFQKA